MPQIRDNTFCLTGTMWTTRYRIEQMIVAEGGRVSNAVRGSDYLVTADSIQNYTKKRRDAATFGVTVVRESQLRESLNSLTVNRASNIMVDLAREEVPEMRSGLDLTSFFE